MDARKEGAPIIAIAGDVETSVIDTAGLDRFGCRYRRGCFVSGLSQVRDAGVGNPSICWKRNRRLRLDVPAQYLWRILQRRLRHDSDSRIYRGLQGYVR
jgi:hypothetical protein